jgi:glycerophosphoryl diester phosphodiesterase
LKTLSIHGHRGARGDAPENTLSGFRLGTEIGVDGLEMDVLVSADQRIVVHHDERLNPELTRTRSGDWLTPPFPLVRELTVTELQCFDVGRARPGSQTARLFPNQVPADGESPPTLTQVANLQQKIGTAPPLLNIEVKSNPYRPEMTPEPSHYAALLVRELHTYDLLDRCWVQSFDWRVLREIQLLEPDLVTGYLSSSRGDGGNIAPHGSSPWLAGFDPDRFGDNIATAIRAAGGRFWGPAFRDLDDLAIKQARSAGIRVHCWTVNEEQDIKEAMDLGVDGLTTDFPERAMRLAGRSPATARASHRITTRPD